MKEEAKALNLVLAGPQNAGKSTLFNLLTTGYARPVNYAGSTVDFNQGDRTIPDQDGFGSIRITAPDRLPGIREWIRQKRRFQPFHGPGGHRPQRIVRVPDASRFRRREPPIEVVFVVQRL